VVSMRCRNGKQEVGLESRVGYLLPAQNYLRAAHLRPSTSNLSGECCILSSSLGVLSSKTRDFDPTRSTCSCRILRCELPDLTNLQRRHDRLQTRVRVTRRLEEF